MDKLVYPRPARHWKQALPLGNGSMGLMVYGGKKTEVITVNDSTLWSGYPKDHDSPVSAKYLDEVRGLIFAGKNSDADALAESKLTGFYSESYMPLGRVKIKFSRACSNNYTRQLNISEAIHTVSGSDIMRQALLSHPDKVAVYSVRAKDKISLAISLDSKLNYSVICDDGINLVGQAPDYVAPNYLRTEVQPVKYTDGKGMAFCLRLEVVTDGVKTVTDGKLKVVKATKIDIFMVTSTGFVSFDQYPVTDTGHCLAAAKASLAGVVKDVDSIKARHIADHQDLYGRLKLNISNGSDLNTLQLYKRAKGGNVDNALHQLYYNYGRYLTIAGSRVGGQAMNLQGIWNNSTRPPWSSNYTTNINAEMNYWGTSSANLAECLSPYIDMIYESMQHGKRTAEIAYNCKGFACNHNVDIWRKTAAVRGSANYMFAPLCGVWLANELCSHYRYGGIEEYKDKVLEVLSEATRFASDFLVMHEGNYVVAPSASPENIFIKGGKRCKLDYASAFDMGLVAEVFDNYIQMLPGGDLADEIAKKRALLYPLKEGQDGVCEWHEYYPTPEVGHRHFSPLYAFHPARSVGYYSHPVEREWVRKLFHTRLDNAKIFFGWSGAWAVNIAARLREGDTAMKVINGMLSHSLFLNLFDMHPPYLFQIDGNFGYVAGVNEMLLTTEDGVIELLPALPRQWSDGSVSGIVAEGGHHIDMAWQGGLVTRLSIKSRGVVKVRSCNIDKALLKNTDNIVYVG